MKRSGSPQSPAFKFKFSVTLEYLEIHKKADWYVNTEPMVEYHFGYLYTRFFYSLNE